MSHLGHLAGIKQGRRPQAMAARFGLCRQVSGFTPYNGAATMSHGTPVHVHARCQPRTQRAWSTAYRDAPRGHRYAVQYAAGPVQSRESGSLSRITMHPGRISAAYRAAGTCAASCTGRGRQPGRRTPKGAQTERIMRRVCEITLFTGPIPTLSTPWPLSCGGPWCLYCRARFPFEGPYAGGCTYVRTYSETRTHV